MELLLVLFPMGFIAWEFIKDYRLCLKELKELNDNGNE